MASDEKVNEDQDVEDECECGGDETCAVCDKHVCKTEDFIEAGVLRWDAQTGGMLIGATFHPDCEPQELDEMVDGAVEKAVELEKERRAKAVA